MNMHSINKTMLSTFTLSLMLATVAGGETTTKPTATTQRGGTVTAPSATTPAADAAAPAATDPSQEHVQGMPALPPTPAPIGSIVAARPFTVSEPWPSDYDAANTPITHGWVVVIEAPFEYVLPRQTQEPVLLAGGMAVERVASLPDEGLILAIVPATPASQAVPGFAAGTDSTMRPLSETAIWFGSPLPVVMDEVLTAQEIVLAESAGITARPQAEISQALSKGGATIEVADRAELFAVLRPWATQFGFEDPTAGPTEPVQVIP